MVFQCRHNIRNQPVSTTIPSQSSTITTIRKHQPFGEIIKCVFSYVFPDNLTYSYTQHRHSQHWFSFVLTRTSLYVQLLQVCLPIIYPRILNLSLVRFRSSNTSISHNICPPRPPTTQPPSSPFPLIKSQHTEYLIPSILITLSLPT